MFWVCERVFICMCTSMNECVYVCLGGPCVSIYLYAWLCVCMSGCTCVCMCVSRLKCVFVCSRRNLGMTGNSELKKVRPNPSERLS